MPYPISTNQHRDLINLINGTYLDQVDRITAAQVDDKDNIIAVAMDGKKKLAVKVTDDNIAIRLMGGEPAANALKFAAPEKKPKNCSKGISCGASCIAASKTCRKKTTPTQKAQKTKIVKEAKVPKAKAIENGKKPAKSSKKDNLADLSDSPTMFVEKAEKAIEQDKTKKEAIKQAVAKKNGSLATTPEEEVDGWPPSIKGKLTIEEQGILLDDEFSVSKDKQAKLMADGLTKPEAIGLGSYIGSDYSDMNQLFWDKNAEKNLGETGGSGYAAQIIAKNKAARDGLAKIKSFTLEELNDYSKSKGGEKYDGKRPLLHGMKKISPEVAKAMYEQHQAIMDAGGTKLAGKFLSTSWQKDGNPSFMVNSNIVIKVTPKTDGSGSGKLVDKYKNGLFESEVLYPPDTKFKVTKVAEIKAAPAKTIKIEKVEESEQYGVINFLAEVISKGEVSKISVYHINQYIQIAEKYNKSAAEEDKLPFSSELEKTKKRASILAKLSKVAETLPKESKFVVDKYIPAQKAGYEFHYQEI